MRSASYEPKRGAGIHGLARIAGPTASCFKVCQCFVMASKVFRSIGPIASVLAVGLRVWRLSSNSASLYGGLLYRRARALFFLRSTAGPRADTRRARLVCVTLGRYKPLYSNSPRLADYHPGKRSRVLSHLAGLEGDRQIFRSETARRTSQSPARERCHDPLSLVVLHREQLPRAFRGLGTDRSGGGAPQSGWPPPGILRGGR